MIVLVQYSGYNLDKVEFFSSKQSLIKDILTDLRDEIQDSGMDDNEFYDSFVEEFGVDWGNEENWEVNDLGEKACLFQTAFDLSCATQIQCNDFFDETIFIREIDELEIKG